MRGKGQGARGECKTPESLLAGRGTGRSCLRRLPLGRLALGTKLRTAAGEAEAADLRATRRARLARAAVDRELILEAAAKPGPADVVADGRAAGLDRTSQDRFDRFAEPIAFLGLHALAEPAGMQFRTEQRLVGIDIPDPGDDCLIEEDRLDGARRATDGAPEILRVHPERLGTEFLVHLRFECGAAGKILR